MSKLLISQYHNEVDKIIQFGGSCKETAVCNAFLNLLNQYCESKHFLLIPELDYKTKFDTVVYPDGTVKDALRLDWGYWESKGQEHNLDAKIRAKFNTYRFADYKEHVIDLLRWVCTISVRTMEIIQQMERLNQ